MTDLLQTIANDLYQARIKQEPIEFVRHRLNEGDKESAYEISELVTRMRESEGVRRVGRKVGLTNPVVQQRAGVDEPDYGVVLEDMVYESGYRHPRKNFIHPKIEGELAFVLKDSVLEESFEALVDAVDYVVPAMELVDNRYPDYRMSIVDTIADNAACEGIVVGDVRKKLEDVPLTEVEMVLYKDNEEITRGKAADVMGNPLKAIHWLARTAIRIGRPLQAGEILLSGSIGIIVDWDTNATYTASFSHGLGEVTTYLEEEQ